jgi:hypothetical protein
MFLFCKNYIQIQIERVDKRLSGILAHVIKYWRFSRIRRTFKNDTFSTLQKSGYFPLELPVQTKNISFG